MIIPMHHFIFKVLGMAIIALPLTTGASIVINATRVIYPENEKEVTVKINNNGKSPVLIQSWIDNGDLYARPDQIQVPFTLTPPINRVDPDKSQTLRLSYTGSNLASDKETVYWLNVLEIPRARTTVPNRLQVAFRSRIKLFFRPKGLTGNASDAAQKLSWSINNNKAVAHNNSPYYVSLVAVSIGMKNGGVSTDGELVPPYGKYEFSFKQKHVLTPGTPVTYIYVNDWGGVKRQTSSL